MTYWLTGDEEHDDPRFTTASLGLYTRAGSWCMGRYRYRPEAEIPTEWFISGPVVRGWGALRLARDLVQQGVWESVPGGWRYAWIRPKNTADYMRAERKASVPSGHARRRRRWPTPLGSQGRLPRGAL